VSQDVDRRAFERCAIAVEVSAWSLVQPTRLLSGTTVDLSGGGAVLRLPGLAESAVRLTLRLDLTDRLLTTLADVVRRQPPDLVAVVFHDIDSSERACLLEFLERSG